MLHLTKCPIKRKKTRGVYSFLQLEKFPPPLYFQLDFLPQGKKSAKRFLSFLGVERGGYPLARIFFFGNLSIILAFSEQSFHNVGTSSFVQSSPLDFLPQQLDKI